VLFIDATLVVETLGLVGFGVYVVVIVLCAILSFAYDLVGNAREVWTDSE